MKESVELYRKHRPTNFKQVVGQTAAIKSLIKKVKKKKVPHALIFVGPSGCGKTTLARILSVDLGAKDMDITEINSAHFKGIETIRELKQQMGRAPFGKCRVWILNEVHQYRKDAQDAMLEMLEDTPDHVYFVLTTTDPQNLNEAFKSRCTSIKVRKLNEGEMKGLIKSVLKKEKKKIKKSVIEKLMDVADGAPRKALNILNSVIHLKKTNDQLDVIQSQDIERQAIELARKLMQPWSKWSDIAKIILELGEEGDTARRIIAGYGTSVALGGGKNMSRGLLMMDCFMNPYYNVSGKTGLTWSASQMMLPAKPRKK